MERKTEEPNIDTEDLTVSCVKLAELHLHDGSKTFDCDLETDSKTTRLKRSEKKILRHEQLLVKRKSERKEKRIAGRARKAEQRKLDQIESNGDLVVLSKKEMKSLTKKKCENALEIGQRVCVDLALQEHMSQKEISKLAQQLCRLYGINRKVDRPCHVYFTGFRKDSELYSECVRKFEGFENYLVEMTEKSHIDVFDRDEIVYLSPDSDNVLETIDEKRVYIIGGLVDESVKRHISQGCASKTKITTARLPISEYMTRKPGSSHSAILTVNQVFEILLTYTHTKDWHKALLAGVPPRKGFVLRELSDCGDSPNEIVDGSVDSPSTLNTINCV